MGQPVLEREPAPEPRGPIDPVVPESAYGFSWYYGMPSDLRWRWPFLGAGPVTYAYDSDSSARYQVERHGGEVRLRHDRLQKPLSDQVAAQVSNRLLASDATGDPVVATPVGGATAFVAFPTADGYRLSATTPDRPPAHADLNRELDVVAPPDLGAMGALQLQVITGNIVLVYVRIGDVALVDELHVESGLRARTIVPEHLMATDLAWPADLAHGQALGRGWEVEDARYRVRRRAGAVVMTKQTGGRLMWTATLLGRMSASGFDEHAVVLPHGKDVAVVLYGDRHATASLVDGDSGAVTWLGPAAHIDAEGVARMQLEIGAKFDAHDNLLVYGRSAAGDSRSSLRMVQKGSSSARGTVYEARLVPRPITLR